MIAVTYVLGKSQVKKIVYEFVSCLHFFVWMYENLQKDFS